MKKKIALTLVLTSCAFTGAMAGEKPAVTAMEHLRPQAFIDNKLPFSAAVRVGNMLYLSGQVGLASGSNKLVEGGIQAESRQTMDNIKMTVEEYGSDMDHVINCTVFLADIAEWGTFNEVYVTYFKAERMPARSAFGANGLALGARVEVQCNALIPGN